MRFIATLLLSLLASPARAASPDPMEILAKVDEEFMRAKDQFLVYDMVTTNGSETMSSFTIQAVVKGKTWRRVDFLAPADRKGIKLLVLSPTQMYIYLPQFKKVRRVASHVQEQGFMGTAYDHAEVSLNVYSDVFVATKASDAGAHWTLKLERRKGQDYAHAALEMDVDKKMFHPLRIRYLNADGTCAKTEKRMKFQCSNTFCRPWLVTMVDHRRDDLKTTMTLKKQKVNVGAPDSYFSVRALEH